MPLRVAVIGLGGIAQKAFLPVLGSWNGIELFLYNRSPEKVEFYRRLYRVAAGSSSLKDVFAWGPEAVFVLTTPETHFEFIQQFLEAGIDVFSEKPATYDSKQTRALAELADSRGRILMVGFNRRFSPLTVNAKQSWGDRPIGLAFFEKHRAKPLHTDLYRQLIDDTVHVIDMFSYFCGDARVLQSVAQRLPDGQIGAVMSTLELENAGHGVISASLQAGSWVERYTLHGSSQTLEVNSFSSYRIVDSQKETRWKETYDSSWKTTLEGRGFVGEIAHFFDCVRTRQQPLSSAWDSVKTQELVEAMLTAAS